MLNLYFAAENLHVLSSTRLPNKEYACSLFPLMNLGFPFLFYTLFPVPFHLSSLSQFCTPLATHHTLRPRVRRWTISVL